MCSEGEPKFEGYYDTDQKNIYWNKTYGWCANAYRLESSEYPSYFFEPVYSDGEEILTEFENYLISSDGYDVWWIGSEIEKFLKSKSDGPTTDS